MQEDLLRRCGDLLPKTKGIGIGHTGDSTMLADLGAPAANSTIRRRALVARAKVSVKLTTLPVWSHKLSVSKIEPGSAVLVRVSSVFEHLMALILACFSLKDETMQGHADSSLQALVS